MQHGLQELRPCVCKMLLQSRARFGQMTNYIVVSGNRRENDGASLGTKELKLQRMHALISTLSKHRPEYCTAVTVTYQGSGDVSDLLVLATEFLN